MLHKQFILNVFIFCNIFNLTLTQTIKSSKIYYKDLYSSNHWALQPYKLTDQKVVALAYYKNCEYTIYMNPTDKRGYRSIIRLINNNDMSSTINREYTSYEKRGLFLLIQLMMDVYNNVVPITQIAIAGNNSHLFDQESGTIYIGKSAEPSFLHAHIWGRGNPECTYIEDVKLDGPIPGLNFDMMAKMPNEIGNNKKISWKDEELKKVVNCLKSEIKKIKENYKELELMISTN